MTHAPLKDAARPAARDRIIEILISILMIVLAWAAIVIAMDFRSSGLKTDIGPARFPILYATILIMLCSLLIAKNAIALVKQDYDPPSGSIAPRTILIILIGIAATFAQYLSMNIVGYPLAMTAYLIFLMALMGMRHLLFNPLIAVTITSMLYLTFDYLLKVPLPMGILFDS